MPHCLKNYRYMSIEQYDVEAVGVAGPDALLSLTISCKNNTNNLTSCLLPKYLTLFTCQH